MRTGEEAGLRTVWVQQRRDKSWRVCAEGMQLSVGPNASSRSNRHVRRKKDIQRSCLKMKLSLQVFGRRRREEENDINGITWGICTQSGTRKDLILILGGSNLQMRSSEVLVLTGARPIAGRAPRAVNNRFCSDMDGSDYCGRHCPAPTPATTVHRLLCQTELLKQVEGSLWSSSLTLPLSNLTEQLTF